MRPLLFLLLAACGSGKLVLEDASGGATDVDTAAEVDTDGVIDTGEDADSGPTDSDSADVPGPTSVDYTGTVSGTLTLERHGGTETLTCGGDAAFTVTADGVLSGEASCTADRLPPLEGALTGTVASGAAAASWSVTLDRGTPADLPLTGSATGTSATLRAELDMGHMGELSVKIEAVPR